jgi:membrane protein required for beta-lactamase induction
MLERLSEWPVLFAILVAMILGLAFHVRRAARRRSRNAADAAVRERHAEIWQRTMAKRQATDSAGS